MRSLTCLAFVLLSLCSWGVFGPILHVGQESIGASGELGILRPFFCIGLAYFLIAVIFPLFVLLTKGEAGNWNAIGFFWSFLAGLIGAAGVFGIILAFSFRGDPLYVMPLVFGLAPVVITLVNMLTSGTIGKASMLFYVAILVVAIGAAGVLMFKPSKQKQVLLENVLPRQTLVSHQQDEADVESEKPPDQESAVDQSSTEDQGASEASPPTDSKPVAPNFLFVTLCVAGAALCWGIYGPMLHRGQAKMGGSLLRPLLCVGLAFFVIAVVMPWIALSYFPEPGGWSNYYGVGWSILAGSAGAAGAIGIIYAFHFGGKPLLVMAIVFGFAPVINTIAETLYKGLYNQIGYTFWISLLLVIMGSVMVLVCAPSFTVNDKPKPAAEPPPNALT